MVGGGTPRVPTPTGVDCAVALQNVFAPVLTDDIAEAVRPRPAWHRDALCQEYPKANWFPHGNHPNAPAKRICSHCLVQADCLRWALDQGSKLPGIWGGTTKHDRAVLPANGT